MYSYPVRIPWRNGRCQAKWFLEMIDRLRLRLKRIQNWKIPFGGAPTVAASLRIQCTDLDDTRLDVGRSDMVYNRMRKAIEKLQHDPAIQDKALASNSVAILQGTYLRDILLRTYNKSSPNELATTHELSESNIADTESPSLASRQPESRPGIFKDNQLIHSWTQRYSKLNPVIIEGDPEFPHLNVTQVRALACMLGEQFSLIQGVCIDFKTWRVSDIGSTASRNGKNQNHCGSHQALEGLTLTWRFDDYS